MSNPSKAERAESGANPETQGTPRGVVGAILAAYDSLSPAERRVASHVLHNRDEAAGLDASVLAERSGTSAASVTRFVRSVGFPSYAKFRLALAGEGRPKPEEAPGAGAIAMDDVAGSLAYIAEHKVDELRACAREVDPAALEACARLIGRSRVVVFAGIGSSLSMAQLAAIRFNLIGVRAVSLATEDATAMLASSLSPEDCVILCTNSGDSRRLSFLMDTCEESAVPTAILTGNPNSELARRAGVCVSYPIYDHLFVDDFVFSASSMNFVVESLLLLLLHSSGEAGGYLQKSRNLASLEKRDVHFPFRQASPASDGFSNP